MKEKKKILAILAAALVLVMFCMPIVFAFGKGEKAGEYFRISLGIAIIGPILIYICMMIFRSRAKRSGAELSGIRYILFNEGNVLRDPAWESWSSYLKDRGYQLLVLSPDGTGSESFDAALRKYGFTAEKSVFIDDSEENCKAARSAGIAAVRFESFRQAAQELEKLGVS